MRYRVYRWWQKFLHRHNFCHVRHSYPEGPDGVDHFVRCTWCGIGGVVFDEPKLRRVAAEMSAEAAS